MARNFALALGAFAALVALGVAFGMARDLYSTERGILSGEVARIDMVGQAYKSPTLKAPALVVKLDDGRRVEVAARSGAAIAIGQRVSVVEMAMPWGQLWYKLQAK